jgi:hypothetical protein
MMVSILLVIKSRIVAVHQRVLDVIQKEDIRIKQITPKTYSLSELREYRGNGDELRFLSKQVYKGFREANKRLSEIESRLKFLLS